MVKDTLEKSSKDVESAEIAGISASIPQMQAQFEAAQKERQREDAETRKTFQGTAEERQQLIANQNQREALLTKQHGAEVNKLAKEAQNAYLQALRDHNAKVAEATSQVRQSQIESTQALLNLQRAGTGGGLNLDAQDASFSRLIALQKEAAQSASALSESMRATGATSGELVQAQQAEQAAYTAVKDSIQGQIDKLKELRQEQIGVIEGGAQVIDYAKNAEKLTGNKGLINKGDVGEILEAQSKGLQRLYAEAIKSNAPLQERLELQKQLLEVQNQEREAGFRPTPIDPNIVRLIENDALGEVKTAPARIAAAVANARSIDQVISKVGAELTEATQKLTDLVGAAASDQGLELKVTVDTTGLEQAREALRGVFGDEVANRIVEQAENAGTRGGAGFVSALAKGVTSNSRIIENAIRDLMRNVDDYLPHSDSRKGPLKNLTASGGKLSETFASGMLRRSSVVESAAYRIAAYAKPAFNIPTTRQLPPTAAAFAGAGGPSSTVINVGNSALPASSMTESAARMFAQTAVREARLIVKRGS